jgi:hypothetical protein
VNEIGDGLEKVKNVEWKSESEGVGRVEKNVIDGRRDEEEVFLCLIFDGEGSLGKQTERHLIRNKIDKKTEDDDNDDDGKSTESTNPNEGGNAGWIILVVFLSLLLIGAGIAIVFFVLRYRRKIRILEEDAMKKSEVTTKENGIEMLEKKEDVNNSCSDSSFDCSSFKKDDENCTSSSALLPDRTETITYSHTGPSEEDAKKEKEEKEKKQKEEEEKQRLEEQEEEQRKERERLNVSTESLHYLTSGLASLEPFNVEYCDIRDSIFHHYIHNEGKKPNFERRRNVAVKIYFELGGVCMYVMTIGEEGEDYLSGLSPFSIVISSSSTSSFILVRESEVVGSRVYGGGIDAFRMKMSRWKSPERLNGQITKENEKSIVYTLSMIVFTIMDLTIPFEDILSDELTVGKVTMGERPSLDHLINCHCDLVDLIVNSWSGIPYERMGLYDLRMKAAEMNCEGGTQTDEDYE